VPRAGDTKGNQRFLSLCEPMTEELTVCKDEVTFRGEVTQRRR